ncbi:hypothetical protein CDL12_23468 [Handroanthus impetiginosus]|uniref:DUF7138 domain-containing protein n=1 Tax=Handroanthus impetiginosus TaxID=429701 RepID=A0A2G9GFD3_9LAMI|nr:hypothetical protein CDL12_23468 [Handroanthus impetiginosus]
MVEGGGGGPAFPVVFFDGEREMNIGDVSINPALEYKPFQLMLSQKIGISPNQISIYLVDRKKNSKSSFSEDRRRIPITGKVNFGSICRQKDCCFLVVLKRSRKSRNRRERMISSVEFADFLPEDEFPQTPSRPMPDSLILLRRDQPASFYDQITQSEIDELNGRLQSLRIQAENYQKAMAKGNVNYPELFVDPNLNLDSFPAIDDIHRVNSTKLMMTKNETNKAFCEECRNAKKDGETASFHHCVNDTVITRFTTRLGPINRPNKSLP